MIQPLTLGNKTFPINLVQGPLAGVSSAPFRLLTWRYSKPAFSYTEMISCKTIIHQPQLATRFVQKDPEEGPVCFQLSGNHPGELAEATKRVSDYGADLIDLNCGCPVKKIRGKGAGSKLLTDSSTLFQLINAMKQHTDVPVSVKIRVEGESGETFHHDVINAIKDGGADFVTVHGRHWTEKYDTPCRHDEIAFFVNELAIPVIGNGDIANLASLKAMQATGCAGMMIARAGVGQPWLIKKLMAEAEGNLFAPPSRTEISELFLEHVERLSLLLNNEKFAILQARKFSKYYARTLETRTTFCEAVNTCEKLTDLRLICRHHFN